MIYLISTHYYCGNLVCSRTWGFYESLSEAQDAVDNNVGAMDENGCYNWLTIEEAGAGIIPDFKRKWFYRVKGRSWVKARKPLWAKQFYSFSIG